MEQMQTPATYDFRQYDQVWQRVSPTLDPYPGMCPGAARMEPQPPAGPAPGFSTPSLPSQPAPGIPAVPGGVQPTPALPPETLPGAQANPCCMGSAALDDIGVLQGFIEEELADARYYAAFARQSPSWMRQTLREIGAEEAEHARRLLAVHYLITGECHRPAMRLERISVGPVCTALRSRYHEEACGGFNYARAADGTPDLCLQKILSELSRDEYRHAEQMLSLLERALRQSC